jgi:hypothetical protein
MRTRFDQFAKGLLTTALSPIGEVRTQVEIHGEVQAADVLFLPARDHEAERVQLGLLGRMAENACLLEPFHEAPDANEALDCLTKQLTLRRSLVREARKEGRAPEIPHLWILSAGRPETVLAGLGFHPLADWPTGVWQAAPLLSTRLIVLRDLPETRATLPLRLLGAGPTLTRAIAQVNALPASEWEPRALMPLLLALPIQVPQDHPEEDDMSYVEELQTTYRRVQAQAFRKMLVNVYETRFGPLPPGLREAIEAMEDEPTLLQWGTLFGTATADEIAATLLPGQPGPR